MAPSSDNFYQSLFGKLYAQCRSVAPGQGFRFKETPINWKAIRHCERSEAIQCLMLTSCGLPRRCAPRNDESIRGSFTAATIAAIYKQRWQIELLQGAPPIRKPDPPSTDWRSHEVYETAVT